MTSREITYLDLTPRAPFDFEGTVRSHGWVLLPPNVWNADRRTWTRIERLRSGNVVQLEIAGAGSVAQPRIQITAQSARPLSAEERAEILTAVGWMLRADEDFSAFYALCRERGEPWIRATQGLGRLLRSPTLFEDVVKTICTTNIKWSGTQRMVTRLVEHLGAPFPGEPGQRAFPTPEAIAAATPERLRAEIRLGYRAPFIHTLAVQVAGGSLDLEAWRDPALPTPVVKRHLLAIKGVGAYAAASLLMLLGRYDDIARDTVFRDFVSAKYFDGQTPPEVEARALYDAWGPWKFLAYWFDLWSYYEP
ncbi:MAG: Fe-S cluster assembly protein HesB [Anaerolineae bacterium]|nr:Fe-S cluster assembly protein HesB [Anaerolineae bacterium]